MEGGLLKRWLLIFLLGVWSAPAWGQAPCGKLAVQGQRTRLSPQKIQLLQQASDCFFQSFLRLSSKQDKNRKISSLRFAIEALTLGVKAATQQRKDVVADQMRVKLVGWLRSYEQWLKTNDPERYTSEKDVLVEYAQRRALLKRQIRYTSLYILTGRLSAQICLWNLTLSQKKSCKKTSRWALKGILAGHYRIRVVYQKKAIQSQEVHLERESKQERVVYFTPPFSSLLVVTSDPQAKIFVEDESGESLTATGERKTFLGLAIGKYKVTVRYRFSSPQTRTILLQAKEPASLVFRPPPPTLFSLHSQPEGAFVTIDQTPRGVTPLAGVQLEMGLRRIRVEKPCYLPAYREQVISEQTQKILPLTSLVRDPAWTAHQKLQQEHLRKQQGTRNIGLALILSGAAAVVTGAILLGVGISANQDATQVRDVDPVRFAAEFSQQTGTHFNIAGAAVSGVGIAAVIPGLLLQLRPLRPLKTEPPCVVRSKVAKRPPAR